MILLHLRWARLTSIALRLWGNRGRQSGGEYRQEGVAANPLATFSERSLSQETGAFTKSKKVRGRMGRSTASRHCMKSRADGQCDTTRHRVFNKSNHTERREQTWQKLRRAFVSISSRKGKGGETDDRGRMRAVFARNSAIYSFVGHSSSTEGYKREGLFYRGFEKGRTLWKQWLGLDFRSGKTSKHTLQGYDVIKTAIKGLTETDSERELSSAVIPSIPEENSGRAFDPERLIRGRGALS